MDYEQSDIESIMSSAAASIDDARAAQGSTSKETLKDVRRTLRESVNNLRDLKLFYTRKKQLYDNAAKQVDIMIKKVEAEEKNSQDSFWCLVRDFPS